MHLSILILAAAASATRVVERDPVAVYPFVQILPISGYANASDGFNALAAIYSDGSGKLASQANAIGEN